MKMRSSNNGNSSIVEQNFLHLVLQVFRSSFNYQAPMTVTQFFQYTPLDGPGAEANKDIVSNKSQLIIDLLNLGLSIPVVKFE